MVRLDIWISVRGPVMRDKTECWTGLRSPGVPLTKCRRIPSLGFLVCLNRERWRRRSTPSILCAFASCFDKDEFQALNISPQMVPKEKLQKHGPVLLYHDGWAGYSILRLLRVPHPHRLEVPLWLFLAQISLFLPLV